MGAELRRTERAKKNSGSHQFLKVVFLRCKGEKKRKSKVRYTKIIKDLSAVRCVGTGGSISNAGFS